MDGYFCLLFCLKILLVFATFKTKVKFKIKIRISQECLSLSMQAHSLVSRKLLSSFLLNYADE